jgi:hypothetical protein
MEDFTDIAFSVVRLLLWMIEEGNSSRYLKITHEEIPKISNALPVAQVFILILKLLYPFILQLMQNHF